MKKTNRYKNPVISKIRRENNMIAETIRMLKFALRRGVGKQNTLYHQMRKDSRCRHIAYCELRGRKRDEIEKPGVNNWRVNEGVINLYKRLWRESLQKEAEFCKKEARCRSHSYTAETRAEILAAINRSINTGRSVPECVKEVCEQFEVPIPDRHTLEVLVEDAHDQQCDVGVGNAETTTKVDKAG